MNSSDRNIITQTTLKFDFELVAREIPYARVEFIPFFHLDSLAVL